MMLFVPWQHVGAQNASKNEAIDTALYVAIYDYQCRTLDDEGQPVTDQGQIAVQVGRHVVKSMSYANYLLTSKESHTWSISDAATRYQEFKLHIPTVFTNHPEGETTVREFIHPNEFEGSEPTPSISWTLCEDTLTVGGYACRTATCTFRGLEWHVCYTEEVPSSAGPWRLHGLPGLIVQAESEAHTFCLTELQQENSPIIFDQNPNIQRMRYDKYLSYKNKTYSNKQYPKNPNYYLPDLNSYITYMEIYNYEGDQQYLYVNGQPLLMKAHVYQPLELE